MIFDLITILLGNGTEIKSRYPDWIPAFDDQWSTLFSLVRCDVVNYLANGGQLFGIFIRNFTTKGVF